ncbi:hypothetical protein MKW98_018890 [Papaver atlanticum]|uniref:HXXXD-type acyl-transferase family protein n=1 Tax=Papaver atlanticum TaxID=357466 RepID=A0AAD4TFW8_9MAGN|nr:hypothetical protein MKW98_018890 [Papaver atlanticum]
MSRATGLVRCLSRCTIKPYLGISKQAQLTHQQERKRKNLQQYIQKPQAYNLTPWDISLISAHYNQVGLLFAKPTSSLSISSVDNAGDQHRYSPGTLVDQLKHSLSRTLAHFLPLSGRFVTSKNDDQTSLSISIKCNDDSSQGVDFIHAAAPVTLYDILSPRYIPPIVRSFFASYDDGTMLMVKHDGNRACGWLFIGCSINHAVVDGMSFWHFFNAWAEICRAKENSDEFISRPAILERWFLKEHQKEVDNDEHQDTNSIIHLPFSHPDEFIHRYPPPPLVEKIFHFSAQSMSQLKEQANNDALVWRSLARARGFHAEQVTNCEICINDRKRLSPPLSDDYFGCYINIVTGKTKTWDLLSQNLGKAALILHEAIADHTDETIRSWLHDWKKEPKIFQLGSHYDNCSLIIGGSPKFNPYGCDFGWGKPLAVRSGWTNKFSGTVRMNPGQVGGGSVDLEIYLSPEAMSALESDEEFMDAHHEEIM